MTFAEFIKELEQKRIDISYSGGKLKYSGPEKDITPGVIESLKKFKGRLIKHFWPENLSNLMPINPTGSKIPLFTVHGDNGNYVISKHLGEEQPLFGFFHPGSEGEAIRYKSTEEIAASYLEKVQYINSEGPYYLIGFSFGGVIAYEMAVQLQKKGYEVPFLVIVDSYSPLAKEPVKWKKTLYGKIRSNILRPVKEEIKRQFKLAKCGYYIMSQKPIPPEMRKFYMFDKYRVFTRKYKPGRFNGEILLFKSLDNNSSYKYLGWDRLVNNIKMVFVKAQHTKIFELDESISVVNTEIERYLEDIKISIP